jgi:26S proteasome regulatory subunit N8
MPSNKNLPTKVVVHPLVLLSTVDHYNRVAKDTKKRVVGVLLGEIRKTKAEVIVDVTNSYAGYLRNKSWV